MKKYLIFILILAWFFPFTTHAADMFMSAEKKVFAQNEEFLVKVSLDTKEERVNAVEGTVSFPTDLLELKEVRDGNSAINFWIEKPSEREAGKVSFSGITTGGFSGPEMFLFSLVLRGKQAGNSALNLENVQVLANDGLGTKISTKIIPFNVSVSEGTGTHENLAVDDTTPPESFTPFISSDPSLFDGKYFAVWSTVDKQTGIDHYEVKESRWFWLGGLGDEYAVHESPYLLEDQALKSRIYIKAIDKAGNERIAKIGPQNKLVWLEQGLFFGIILLICLFCWKKIYGRKRRTGS